MRKTLLLLLLFLLNITISCNKDKTTILENESNTYIAGYEQVSTSTSTKPLLKIWSENKTISYDLSIDNNAFFTSIKAIKVHNGVTYAVGYFNFNDKEDIGALWIDGVLTSFGDGTKSTRINDIFINGSDIYMVGTERIKQYIKKAKLWKNGNPIDLTNGSEDASANSIFVKDNNVYILGSEGKKSVVWKNNEPTYLTSGNDYSSAKDIKISGKDVYVLLNERNPNTNTYVTKIWKNGELTNITDGTYGSSGNSLYLHNNDIYITGRIHKDNKHYPVYWKNNELIELERGNDFFASANDIIIKNNDIYIIGQSNKVASLWKNGVRLELSNSTTSYALSLYESNIIL